MREGRRDRRGQSMWAEYLLGINRGLLCDCIAAPTEEANGLEAVARRIWVAMGEVAQISQQITKATGNAIRSEAVRTEKDRSPVQPLQA
ncbi:uncharacterized protein N7473_000052 [Penicillium subrubescens]|uniref:uncharacterized protein n=1 Tax=Penicillium subrubescens TaxID=1316194 RepID=UPI0025459098|nr:uncharacterized protein N7473_000052 [Penicillium subrubescens]KAJ5910749.1 hypothetical protein N7473_000052 [Penicillium subrubescens]